MTNKSVINELLNIAGKCGFITEYRSISLNIAQYRMAFHGNQLTIRSLKAIPSKHKLLFSIYLSTYTLYIHTFIYQ